LIKLQKKIEAEKKRSFFSRSLPTTNYQLSTNQGFTLVEVIVVIAIFTVLTGVVFANYKGFTGGTVLSNAAYSVALSIRQAQVYGISVKGQNAGFGHRYGVTARNSLGNSVVVFVDTNNNNAYDTGEQIETINMLQGLTVSNFCVTLTGGTDCKTGASPLITYVDIMFRRPDPDALYKSDTPTGGSYISASITLLSPQTGKTKTITVYTTGQISVQ
jgi:prepilin-type N-terminal cleavage/methylation domain-containing protein